MSQPRDDAFLAQFCGTYQHMGQCLDGIMRPSSNLGHSRVVPPRNGWERAAPPPEANIAAELRAALQSLAYVQRCAGHKLDQPEADSMDRGVRIVRGLVTALTTEGPPR